MNKTFSLKVGDRTLKLCFNVIFAEQMGKILKCDAAPNNIMAGMLALNKKSSMLMFKAIVYCGVLGVDYVVGFEESITQEEVGKLIFECEPKQLSEIFQKVSKELGYDLNAEPQEDKKKAVKKTVKKKS